MQQLADVVTIQSGTNTRQLREKAINRENLYTVNDAKVDLLAGFSITKTPTPTETAEAGDLLFSLMAGMATIVSPINQGKYLSQGFAKMVYDYQVVDPWYLCYLLNESTEIKREMAKTGEGVTFRHLTPRNLKELKIALLPLDQQRKVGEIYRRWQVNEHLALENLAKQKDLVLNTLASYQDQSY